MAERAGDRDTLSVALGLLVTGLVLAGGFYATTFAIHLGGVPEWIAGSVFMVAVWWTARRTLGRGRRAVRADRA